MKGKEEENAAFQVRFMCEGITTVLSLPVQTPAGTVQSVRDLMRCANERAPKPKGNSTLNSEPLVDFLYTLMRDYLTAGEIEEIIVNHVEKAWGLTSIYSNKHLAAYATDLAARLTTLDAPRKSASE